jgi:protein ImuA
VRPTSAIESLRVQVRQIEGRRRRATTVLPFGIAAVDSRLPGGGLLVGALHEVAGGGNGAIDGAAAALFTAGIAARTRGKVLWCVTRPDLFAPALSQAGLKSDRVIYLDGSDEKTVLACFEEGLRHGGLGAVVAEVARLPMTASRRLQLASEGSGAIGIALRRWRRQGDRFRPAHRRHDPLARLGATFDASPCPGRRPTALAGRADPLPRWRERRFRTGGVR